MPDSVNYFVYIITNKNNTVLYTGFTDDLERRIYEHRNNVHKGFAAKYNCYELLYFEEFKKMKEALYRERQLKKYRRQWKENLINEANPDWRDLYDDFIV
jgi:putative endonuclease